jgi:hypothetical protein
MAQRAIVDTTKQTTQEHVAQITPTPVTYLHLKPSQLYNGPPPPTVPKETVNIWAEKGALPQKGVAPIEGPYAPMHGTHACTSLASQYTESLPLGTDANKEKYERNHKATNKILVKINMPIH